MSRRAYQMRRTRKAEEKAEARQQQGPRCPPRKRRRLDPDRDHVKERAQVILSERFSKDKGITTTVVNEEVKKLCPGLPFAESELERFRRKSRKALRR